MLLIPEFVHDLGVLDLRDEGMILDASQLTKVLEMVLFQ